MEQQAKLMLDGPDQQRVLAIMSAVAGDHTPVNPPAISPLGMRWWDVPAAVHFACAEVEMAIIQTIKTEDRYVFKLKTLDDRPGEIVINRLNDSRVYEAQVRVGRFKNDQDKADQLLREFDRQLRLFGSKRALASETP